MTVDFSSAVIEVRIIPARTVGEALPTRNYILNCHARIGQNIDIVLIVGVSE